MQDPKYYTGLIINTASGEAIPQEEPVMIFRARDRQAIPMIEFYETLVEDPEHKEAVQRRILNFREFQEQYPERVKEPDTDLKNQGRATIRSEETGDEVGAIAARLMRHHDPEVRALAASCLTQRPDKEKPSKKNEG